jgi:glycosyl transferase family 1
MPVSAGGSIGLAVGATDPLTLSLIAAIHAAAEESGYSTRSVEVADGNDHVDVVLAVGLPGYYEAALRRRERGTRTIAWFGEPVPRDVVPGGPIPVGGRRIVRRVLRLAHRPLRRLRSVPLPGPLAAARAAAYIESERQANLESASRVTGLVDLVVTTSHDGRTSLKRHGIDARVVPFGYHERFAGPLVPPTVPRELDVVSLGTGFDWPSRRARGTRSTLERLGPGVKVANPGRVWGEERRALLSSARVMLDVHRVPGNFGGLRILLALAAGAVLATELLDDPRPFVPGVHYVEAPLADLPAAIGALLADEPTRRRIAEAGQVFVSTELTMQRSLAAVLA